jgi:hypothetical protein
MTMMALTEEDALFELELRIVPVDGKDEYSLNGVWSEACVHASAVTEGCTKSGNCSITCYTRFAPEGADSLAPTMCNT